MSLDQIAARPGKILVPVDLSSRSELAAGYGTMLAQLTGAELLLLMNINASGQHALREKADHGGLSLEEAANEALDQLASRLPTELRVTTKVTFAEYAEDGILETVATAGVDLIVVASHGRGGMGRWILGSVAESITRGGNVPVVVVPAHE